MKTRDLALSLLLMATPVASQDLMRTVEMPGHRALMEVLEAGEPEPFETDGCSGGLSSSWRLVADTFPAFGELHDSSPPWEACCVIHDRAYHNAAGTSTAEESFDARLAADEALKECVVEDGIQRADEFAIRYQMTPEQVRSAYSTIAGSMYLAVRFGGGPCTGLPWRWGFGYPGCTPLQSMVPARE